MDLQSLTISGMKRERDLLWIAAPEERLVASYDPSTRKAEVRIRAEHEVWDICPCEEGLWMMAGGGALGRRLVLWSWKEAAEIGRFHCPDGAGAGVALHDGKLWLTHRHNRKLFCLDPGSGKTNWIIRTESETFSPAAFGSELWLIESDPGPLAHWGEKRLGRYFFSRYDPAREKVVERRPVDFTPSCMALDAERFWYAEQGKKGFASLPRR